jgi:hypothetical protein
VKQEGLQWNEGAPAGDFYRGNKQQQLYGSVVDTLVTSLSTLLLSLDSVACCTFSFSSSPLSHQNPNQENSETWGRTGQGDPKSLRYCFCCMKKNKRQERKCGFGFLLSAHTFFSLLFFWLVRWRPRKEGVGEAKVVGELCPTKEWFLFCFGFCFCFCSSSCLLSFVLAVL